MPARTLSREDYTVGIVCALEMERRVVHATLDEEHRMVQRTTGDENNYVFGRIGEHNVVVACPPVGVIYEHPAAAVAREMMQSFPIKCSLLVGVGGGVWSERTDIRLGDVVVSEPNRTHGGVVEWNKNNVQRHGSWRSGALNKPPGPLLDAVQSLKARHMLDDGGVGANLEAMFAKYPKLRDKYRHQGQEHDELFDAGYGHVGGDTCADCNKSRNVQNRPCRTDEGPQIHYGNIASSTEVVGYGWKRDRIAQEEGILCFETEAAGLMKTFPCVVIRGVCNYADDHENTRWQGYAAAAAAAYAKELLLWMPATDVARILPENEITGIPGNDELHLKPLILD